MRVWELGPHLKFRLVPSTKIPQLKTILPLANH